MEPHRFDTLTRTLVVTGSRRRLLGLLAALPLVGGVAVAERPVDRILDRRRHRPKGHRKDHKRNKHHKGTQTKALEPGPVPAPAAPAPICQERQKPCTTAAGIACCPSVDPNVVCAGGNNRLNMICQDCTAAPTAAGAFCQDPPGNQCCGGSPNCFVGVRVKDNKPACYRTGVCREAANPCKTDADCGGALECAHSAVVPCGCAGDTPTMCVTPCGK